MSIRCLILSLLAVPALGGCGSYLAKQEVKSQYGNPELVQYVAQDSAATTLYGKGKPSALGTVQQEQWYYLNRRMLVRIEGDKWDNRPLSMLEILRYQRVYNDLRRQDQPDAGFASETERPPVETLQPPKR